MSLGGGNYGEGGRPACPDDPGGKHQDDEERMYGETGDGKPAHGKTFTCKRCGMREFIVIY